MKTLSPIQIEYIARGAHEVNRSWCQLTGDHSQVPWEEAPDWQRDSARKGVMSVLRGEHSPQASHESWMAERAAQGWTYGAVKDPVAKTHPCMVAYDALPPEQQYKDTLFVEVVRALADELWRIPQ
jgi:hypothetical protein